MPNGDSGEVALPIEDLISRLTESFTSAAKQLSKTMSEDYWKDSPFVYRMPGMTLEIRLTLSYSENKVKGIFKRSKTETGQEVMSSLRVEIVAVPNPAAVVPPGN